MIRAMKNGQYGCGRKKNARKSQGQVFRYRQDIIFLIKNTFYHYGK